ncbi:hypothetical protein M9H77_34237 [Catharanthus roseus]|uniref:Uncharacterized protein n=1 Tax=Catharanthus roseus TaxID=4058 RepID=A0ACB9ZKM7_CATRO|nr:hypothetical protein M9H77_34237 [Catharanthus roseus]
MSWHAISTILGENPDFYNPFLPETLCPVFYSTYCSSLEDEIIVIIAGTINVDRRFDHINSFSQISMQIKPSITWSQYRLITSKLPHHMPGMVILHYLVTYEPLPSKSQMEPDHGHDRAAIQTAQQIKIYK